MLREGFCSHAYSNRLFLILMEVNPMQRMVWFYGRGDCFVICSLTNMSTKT